VSVIDRIASAIGRAVHRIAHPSYVEERKAIDGLREGLAKVAGAQHEHAERVKREVASLSTLVSALARDEHVQGIEKRMDRLREASTANTQSLERLVTIAERDERLHVDERRLAHFVQRLSRSNQPVIVGPWSGEVGFELLYWIPFVTWVLQQADVASHRILVVSRGGAAPWYAHLGGRYVDVLSQVTAEEFRTRTEHEKKQRTMRGFDREIVQRTIAQIGIERPLLLHPGLMYRLFRQFWKQEATVTRVEEYTQYRRISSPQVPALAGRLPARYVAVRFYFSTCFPDTPDNRRFVDATVRSLAASNDVVLLNTGFHLDDHRDHVTDGVTRIHTLDGLFTPEHNLDVQTAVIAGAQAFVGTYGGYSYLAPLCGVPSVAFYSERDAFFAHHLELADRVFRRLQAGSLVPLDVRDATLVRMVLGSTHMLSSSIS
jgi:hypothetical protein